MNQNKIASIIIVVALVISVIIFFSESYKSDNNTKVSNIEQSSNIEIRDGIQYVIVNARGGYFPRISNAKADVPTKLVIKTQGTYDCSAYLVINSLGYRNSLPSNGETVIDAGTHSPGELLRGTCGMGMYSFTINFN